MTSTAEASTGDQPTDWVMSHTVRAPTSDAARVTSSMPVRLPQADWLWLNTTAAVFSPSEEHSSARGTERTVMRPPSRVGCGRSACTRKG